MGAFTTKKTLYGNASQIPSVAEKIRKAFVLVITVNDRTVDTR